MTIIISRLSNKFLLDATKLRIEHEEMKNLAESNLDLVQQHQIELYEKEAYNFYNLSHLSNTCGKLLGVTIMIHITD